MSNLQIGNRVKYENRLEDWGGFNPPEPEWEGWHSGTIDHIYSTSEGIPCFAVKLDEGGFLFTFVKHHRLVLD